MDELSVRRRGRHAQDPVLIEALAHGATRKDAAERAGVSVRTVDRREKDPEFRAKVEAARARRIETLADEFMDGARRAKNRFLELLDDPTVAPSVQVGIGRALFTAALQFLDAGRYEGRIEEIERLLGTGTEYEGTG